MLNHIIKIVTISLQINVHFIQLLLVVCHNKLSFGYLSGAKKKLINYFYKALMNSTKLDLFPGT